MNDLEFVRNEFDSVLKEASKYAEKDNETKKAFVIRVKEKALILFDQEGRVISELASFIANKLDDIRFSISNSWFYEIFTDEEKGNYSGKFGSEQFIESDTLGVLKSVDSPKIKINDVTYVPEIKGDEKRSKTAQTDDDEPVVYDIDDYTNCINRIAKTSTELYASCQAILKKYTIGILNKDKQVIVTAKHIQTIVQEVLEPVEETYQHYGMLYAKISNSKDVLDDRNKWGDYEKIMAKYLMDGGETIAHISKLMDYSSKFGSIGILNNVELQKKVEQLGNCPKCQANIYFEVNESLKEIEKLAELEL